MKHAYIFILFYDRVHRDITVGVATFDHFLCCHTGMTQSRHETQDTILLYMVTLPRHRANLPLCYSKTQSQRLIITWKPKKEMKTLVMTN